MKVKNKTVKKCSICGKAGHNKSTCPRTNLSQTKEKENLISQVQQKITSAPAPVKFFIHHVQTENAVSPHLVNLKQTEKWQGVEAYNEKNYSSLYHSYHEQTNEKKELLVNLAHKQTPENFDQKETQKYDNSNYNDQNYYFKKIQPLKFNFKTKKIIKLKFNFHPLQKIKESREKILENLKILSLKKISIVAIALMLILIVPLKANSKYTELKLYTGKIAESGTEGFMSLQESTLALANADFGTARDTLALALNRFSEATDVLENDHQFLQKMISIVPILKNQVKSRENLILAGQSLSLGNAYLLKTMENDSPEPNELAEKIENFSLHLQQALPYYQKALAELEEVDADVLPTEYQAVFKEYRKIFISFVNDLHSINDLGDSLQEIFGGQGFRRYLLVFQNENELRATGGFAGSMAILDINNGKIENLNIPAGGSYDLQGQLTEFVLPPSPLLLINKRWEFQDANWFPNFPNSAQKMMWFFQKSRNLTVDGVIAINSDVLKWLLQLTGPIIDEKRDLTIAANNAQTKIQNIVETSEEKEENKPKQILADLAPLFTNFLEKIDSKQILQLMVNTYSSLKEKDIQIYLTDEESQNHLTNFGWTGEIIKTTENQDYLLVINSNIGGQKSDAAMNQEIYHETIVQEDGSIIDNVIIKRRHLGDDLAQFYGETNIDYLRIYVPQGSVLLEAKGFTWPDEKYFKTPESWFSKDEYLQKIEGNVITDKNTGTKIINEFDKTSFGNWVITEPGEESIIKFSYQLPFKIFTNKTNNTINKILGNNPLSKYQLLIQRQSGIDSKFSGQIIYPEGWKPQWKQGEEMTLAKNGAQIEDLKLVEDRIWSLLMELN